MAAGWSAGSSSSSSGSEMSDLSAEDKEIFASSVTLALQKALALNRAARDAIEVLWVEAGSIILGIELDLPYALKLIGLHKMGDAMLRDELRVAQGFIGDYDWDSIELPNCTVLLAPPPFSPPHPPPPPYTRLAAIIPLSTKR